MSDELPPLPPAYAPFAPVLDRLSIPLLRVLHGHLLQFEPLARSLDIEEFAPQGEFEGLGGLTRRGDMAHVVQSELLLRTEAPLEFLRRLAEGETLFHEKQYADPGRRTIHRAMVSVGPGLLGHGRIVALAVLLFLARVAAARGAEFHWCFLPRADGAVWFDEVSVNTIKRFLRAASYREMGMAEMEAAQELWDTLVPDPAEDDTRMVDWVVGAAAAWSPAASPAAVDRAANALAFTLAPPTPGEPREGQLLVCMNGAHRVRAQVRFPEDRVCLSALESPFRPIVPAAVGPASAAPRESRIGWEARWFTVPRVDMKAIRMPDGVLIFYSDKRGRFLRSYLLPIDTDMRLAGIRISGALLEFAMSVERDSGSNLLAYRRWNLLPDSVPTMLQDVEIWQKCHHLFDNRDPWALPPLTGGRQSHFYSASGRPFSLDLEKRSFALEHKLPLTIASDGIHHIVQDDGRPSMLRVFDGVGKLHAAYNVDATLSAEQLQGVCFSRGDRGLAYSVSPERWIVPQGSSGPAVVIETAPHERLLAVSPATDDYLVRLWSDIRLGGDGTVQIFRIVDGKRASHRPILHLGKEASTIVEMRIDDEGGIWALRVDDAGIPTQLLRYGYDKRRGMHERVAHDLSKVLSKSGKLRGDYGQS